jgi:hypothetical protein
MRGCVAFFLFLVIVAPLLFAFEIAAAASTFLVNREFYTDVLASPDVYAAVLEGVLDDAGVSARLRETGELDRIRATLNESEWRDAIQDVIDDVFAVIEGRSNTISISLPLAPVRAILESSAGAEFVRSYVDGLDPCRPGQEPNQVPAGIVGLPLPVCVPQGVATDQYAADLIERLPATLERMPARLTYTATATDFPQVQGVTGFDVPSAVMTALAVLGIMAIGAWLVTGIVAGDGAGSRLRWLGGTLLLPSLVVLLIGLAIGGATATATSTVVLGGVNQRLSQAFADAIVGGAGRIALSFVAAGGIPAAIGALLFVAGLFVPDRRADTLQRDLYANPTAQYPPQYPPKPKNEFDVYKPKNNDKPSNDDVIRPL